MNIEQCWLTGWKEVAMYIGYESEKSAIRAFKEHNLPIYTMPSGRIRALKKDLDEWLKKKNE